MPAIVPNLQDCCSPCEDVVTTQVPGPAGAAGADGDDGTDGVNAFTTINGVFAVPAVGGSVTLTVVNSTWITVDQILYIQGAGYFIVTAVPSAVSVTVQNPSPAYPGNATTGNFTNGGKVSPGGIKGTDGASGSGTLNDLSPTQSKGDLLLDNGTNNPLASMVRFPVGTNGERLVADSAQATGVDWTKVNLASAAEVTGVLPAANGGNSDRLPLAGGNLTGDVEIQTTTPEIRLKETDEGVDEKIWGFRSAGGQLEGNVWDDAKTTPSAWLVVTRSTVNPNLISLFSNLTTIQMPRIYQELRIDQNIDTSLANGANNNVTAFDGVTYAKLKAGPTLAFSITGIANGTDGRVLILHNSTGQNLTIANENASSTALNRILTLTGADFVSTGDCIVKLIYDSDAQRWILMSTQG